MKIIVTMVLALLSLSLFANVDELVGKYVSTDTKGEAVVSRVLIAQPTLFEPAKYVYTISLTYAGSEPLWLRNELLEIGQDGKNLHKNLEIECDDPGCVFFTSVDVEIFKNENGKAVIRIGYEGFKYEEDGEEGYEFQIDANFIKK